MTPLLLAVTTVIYGYVSSSYLRDGRVGMAIAFAAYALANAGFILDAWKK